MNKQSLMDDIDWKSAMNAPRYSGGHEEVMRQLFKSGKVIAEWVQDDHEGEEAFAYEFPDGYVAVITDYFGCCIGCDSWERAPDSAAKAMVSSMVSSARMFGSRHEAAHFCETVDERTEDYSHSAARHLVEQLENSNELEKILNACPLCKGSNSVETFSVITGQSYSTMCLECAWVRRAVGLAHLTGKDSHDLSRKLRGLSSD